jgi:hypothetical protein
VEINTDIEKEGQTELHKAEDGRKVLRGRLVIELRKDLRTGGPTIHLSVRVY